MGGLGLLKYLRYYNYLLKHKVWVFYYCCQYGIIWRGIKHDNDKLFDWFVVKNYANATFGPGRTINYGLKDGMPDLDKDEDFKSVVLLHKNVNDHHLEYWTLEGWEPLKYTSIDWHISVPMKRAALLELIADWKSSNHLHKDFPDCLSWYNKNKEKLFMHKKTRRLIEYILNKGL